MIARTRMPAALPSAIELAERARWLIDCLDVETSTPLIDGRPCFKVDLVYGETVLAQLVAERLPRAMRLGAKAIPEGSSSCIYDLDWAIMCERDVLVQSERREVQPRLFVEMSVDMEDGCFRRAFEAMQACIVKAEGAEAAASAFLCAQIHDRPRRSQIPLYRGVGFACHRRLVQLPRACRAYDLTRSLLLLPKPAPTPDPAPTPALAPTPEPVQAPMPAVAPAPTLAPEVEAEPVSASSKPTPTQRSKLAQQAEQKRRAELRRVREEAEEEEEWVPSTRRKRAAASSTQPKRYKTRQQS